MRRKQAIWKTNWQSLIKVHENRRGKVNNQIKNGKLSSSNKTSSEI